jgi:hypothetical protein
LIDKNYKKNSKFKYRNTKQYLNLKYEILNDGGGDLLEDEVGGDYG